jgi:hypothetical protein
MRSIAIRKLILIFHIGTSVGLFGAVALFFCMSVVGLATRDPSLASAIYLVMPQVTWMLIVPLAVASLSIGILQSIYSPWGLVRHYWVIVKLVLTVVVLIVLLLQTSTIDRLGELASMSEPMAKSYYPARLSMFLHSGGGLVAIATTLVLSVYKPRGLTRHGLHSQTPSR